MDLYQAIDKLNTVPIDQVWNNLFGTSVNLKNGTTLINCPLHGDGKDASQSAKMYEDSNKVHCWACAKTRDIVEVIKDAMTLETVPALAYGFEKYFSETLKLDTQRNAPQSGEQQVYTKVPDNSLKSLKEHQNKIQYLEDTIRRNRITLGPKIYAEYWYILDYIFWENCPKEKKIQLLFGLEEKLKDKING